MKVINELTRKRVSSFNVTRGIVYMDNNYLEFGFFEDNGNYPYYVYDGVSYPILGKNTDTEIVFSKRDGKDIIKNDTKECFRAVNIFGKGKFPYKISRDYEAENHIENFNKAKSKLSTEVEYNFAKHFKYSFGLEFETAAGYIPENKCFELGLIPLRDGSISGVEYSTIPLFGNDGFNRLREQLNCLKEYTIFNKNCSTHIHLGNFPVNSKAIYALHELWYYYQNVLAPYIPSYSYCTGVFKDNGKNYCKTVSSFPDFNSMYKYYVGQDYLGNLYQPHPCDIEKRAKWNIKTRYFNCNFINMLCYNGAKTIEFRFLTPTYSLEKLTTFLLIFNALLIKAEALSKFFKTEKEIHQHINAKMFVCYNPLDLLLEIYPIEIKNAIETNLEKLYCLRQTQDNAGDYCGSRTDIEYKYFPDGQ